MHEAGGVFSAVLPLEFIDLVVVRTDKEGVDLLLCFVQQVRLFNCSVAFKGQGLFPVVPSPGKRTGGGILPKI